MTTTDGARSGVPHFFLNVLRIATGLLFWQHGARKLFALLGADAAATFPSLLWWAGILEFFGGILIALGLLTRPVALLLATEMVVAYFRSHAPRGFWPIMNGGERAALFCFIYLFLAANGGGAFSLDGLIRSRKRSSVKG